MNLFQPGPPSRWAGIFICPRVHPSTALVECAWCQKTLYCSSVCQKQDWQETLSNGHRKLHRKLHETRIHESNPSCEAYIRWIWSLHYPCLCCIGNAILRSLLVIHCSILIIILIACDCVRSLSLLVMIGSLIQSLHHCLSSFLHYEIVCWCTLDNI